MTKQQRSVPQLATVRRFEAAGFRAWPAAAVHYDGTWAIRLTAGHPARRLNSVNPLDPSDTHNLPERIARAARRFDAYGRPLTFRLSPLAGAAISEHLDGLGWSRVSDSIVMRTSLVGKDFKGVIDQIPLKDVGRFTHAALKVHASDPAIRPGLSEIINSITATTGLFVVERDDQPIATAICVHDGELAGLFEIATQEAARGQGHGRGVVLSAMKWAMMRGAKQAWLQVEADNAAALALYRSIGFAEAYRYHYRQPPDA